MDLVRKLESEAEKAGGRVHVVLDKAMNLTRDLRYVPPEGFAAFAAEESEADREWGWKRFAPTAWTANGPPSRAVFDERYPPGFFGRMRAFGSEGDYGAWLLTRPAVVKVNGVLFVHGGLTEQVAALGLEEINRQVLLPALPASQPGRHPREGARSGRGGAGRGRRTDEDEGRGPGGVELKTCSSRRVSSPDPSFCQEWAPLRLESQGKASDFRTGK